MKTKHMVVIGSDVEALYPSLDIEDCTKIIEEEMERTKIKWEGLELGLCRRNRAYCTQQECTVLQRTQTQQSTTCEKEEDRGQTRGHWQWSPWHRKRRHRAVGVAQSQAYIGGEEHGDSQGGQDTS